MDQTQQQQQKPLFVLLDWRSSSGAFQKNLAHSNKHKKGGQQLNSIGEQANLVFNSGAHFLWKPTFTAWQGAGFPSQGLGQEKKDFLKGKVAILR